jgi:hypothetical protein
MQIDQFILRLVFLLIPGVAGYKVYKQLRSSGRSQKLLKDWEDFLNVFLFSLVGYIVLWGGAALINVFGDAIAHQAYSRIEVGMLRAMLDEKVQPEYLEIFLAIIAAMLAGVGAAWATNRKLPFKLFHLIGITNHFGDDDIWSFVMNSDDFTWVIVRDHKLDLAYVARIEQFSDSGEKRELVLGSVDVRNNKNWRLLYEAERLYLSRDDQDLSIEILK